MLFQSKPYHLLKGITLMRQFLPMTDTMEARLHKKWHAEFMKLKV